MAVSHTVVLDLDGTLVDSVYHHVISWHRAFTECGLVVPSHEVHRLIGMGGDRLVTAATNETVESALGDRLRDLHSRFFGELVPEVRPTKGAEDLVIALADVGWRVVLATSGGAEQTEQLVRLVPGLSSLLDTTATGDDADRSKPAGELIERALRDSDAAHVFAVGDAPWDMRAAKDAGVRGVGVLTGGFSTDWLRDAGASAVFDSPEHLARHIAAGHTP